MDLKGILANQKGNWEFGGERGGVRKSMIYWKREKSGPKNRYVDLNKLF